MRVNEQGRSMIEMLGVLAIVGVLSVGGIAGYSKAMTKFKTNKVIDQVNMLSTNIRTLYSSQRTFNGLDNALANKAGAVPAEMVEDNSTSVIQNGFGGDVYITTGFHLTQADNAYLIAFGSIPKAACVTMATTDWGGDVGSGFSYMLVDSSGGTVKAIADTEAARTTDPAAASNIAKPGDPTYPTPMTVVNAQTSCSHATNNMIVWKYI